MSKMIADVYKTFSARKVLKMRSRFVDLIAWCWWAWVPISFRSLILKWIYGPAQTRLDVAVKKFLEEGAGKWTNEEREVADFLKVHPCEMIPYPFSLEQRKIEVARDPSCRMLYVVHNGKRLYFPRMWATNKIKVYYNGLLAEQDYSSPHRYELSPCETKSGDVVVDAGASEGLFALTVVDTCSKIYLIECDDLWKDALRQTFAPWSDKVVFLNVWLSDKDDPKKGVVSLDTCLGDETVDFLKADIEGAEIELIRGSRKIMARSNNMRLAICTYHTETDAADIDGLLTEAGFATSFSRGFIVWRTAHGISLRRGVLRAIKKPLCQEAKA